MYLKKSYNRKTGRTQLFIVEAYRDQNKKPKTKVVKTLGYLDVLEKEYEDPIAYFTEQARRMTAERNESMKQIRLELNPSAVLPKGSSIVRNFGCAAILKVLSELGLDERLYEIPASSKADYNLINLYRIAICCNILYRGWSPATMRKLPISLNANGFTMSDIYRALDVLDHYRSELLHLLYKNTHAPDAQVGTDRFYCYFTEYEFGRDSSHIGIEDLFVRDVGANVHHALFTDASDIPVYYALTTSNAATEQKLKATLEQVLADPALRIHPMVAVAGSASRSFSELIPPILAQGNGYLFCYPLQNADSELQEFALNPSTGYHDTPDPESLSIPEADNGIYHAFFEDFRESHLGLAMRKVKREYTSAEGTRTADELQIVIHSPSFADRAAAMRRKLSESSTEPEALKNGEELDGYFAIVTSEAEASVLAIGTRCLKLVEITDFFTIQVPQHMQSTERSDPSKLLHSAFFLNHICFVVCRLLEQRLNYRYSIRQIRDSLAKCEYTNIENDIYLLNYRDDVLDAIGEVLNIDFSKRFRRLSDLTDLA